MAERDIKAHFAIIHDLAERLAGAELPDAERQVAKMSIISVLFLLEHALCDLNRSADALESIAYSVANQARS